LRGQVAEGEDSSANSLISHGESLKTPAHSFAFRRMRSLTLFEKMAGGGGQRREPRVQRGEDGFAGGWAFTDALRVVIAKLVLQGYIASKT